MTELDGAVAGDFFTVLCVGQSYTEDQWMNMYTFSMIKRWLLTYDTDGSSNTESGNEINKKVLMCDGASEHRAAWVAFGRFVLDSIATAVYSFLYDMQK